MLDWPYVEGLRLDEAMHPLTILATGLYGEALPNQNGAPIRLVVPWKYGFKSIKSIVRITFADTQPPTTWNRQAPQRVRLLRQRQPGGGPPALEPGDASGWSARGCSRSGGDTEPFNGYADQVAGLYAGMDLATVLLSMARRATGSTAGCGGCRSGRSTSLALLPAVLDFWLGASEPARRRPGARSWSTSSALVALQFLIAALAVTPLRELTGVNLLRFRRMLGLLGLLLRAAASRGLAGARPAARLAARSLADLAKRPYIIVGIAALLLLVPLAADLLDTARSGGSAARRWRRLHRLAYPATLLGGAAFRLAGEGLAAASRWSTRPRCWRCSAMAAAAPLRPAPAAAAAPA